MGKQDPLSQHPLVSRRELNLGYSKGVAQVQTPIHVGEWEVPEPFGKLFEDFCFGKSLQFCLRWRVDLEQMLVLPLGLVLLF